MQVFDKLFQTESVWNWFNPVPSRHHVWKYLQKYHICYTRAIHYYKYTHAHRPKLHLKDMPSSENVEWNSYIKTNNFNNYLILRKKKSAH